MARIQRFHPHRGGCYIWLPAEYRRAMKLLRGDHLIVELREDNSVYIARLTPENAALATIRKPTARPH